MSRGPPDVNHMFTLKVDNIGARTSNESLKDKFSPYGEIGDVYIPRSFGSGEPRGFAFVRFLSKHDAEDAMRALDNTELDGREIRIAEAKERRPDFPRGSRGGRRDYYDDRDRRRSRSRSPPRRDYRDRSRDRSRDRDDYRRGGRDRSRS
eukprot:gene41061-50094_t